ncbi:MAG: hypothetical protein QOJ89_4171 [bacterium]|jgi:hypothetical protein
MATADPPGSRAVTVTVAESQLAQIEDVAERLRAAGMHVEQVLPAIGVITGTVPAAQLTALAEVEGVASIEEQTKFELPPPDAEVQ